MELITVTAILLSTMNVHYNNDCKFAYNVEMAEDIVTSQVVYKKNFDGKLLSHHLKYNYTYDEQQRLVKKEVLKWNAISEGWEPSHCLNYVYDQFGFTLTYALWNNEETDYTKNIAKQIYNDSMGGAMTITSYKWNKSECDWSVQSNVLTMRSDDSYLSSFELEM